MMDIPNTLENSNYAASVNARIEAETANVRRTNKLLAARAALWRAVGWSVVLMALGAATGIAFFGYSFISDNRASLDQIAAALGKALQRYTLRTEGSVAVQPGATVALADGSHVALDPSSVSLSPGGVVSMQPGTVGLAPGSTVGIRSEMPDIVRKIRQTDGGGKPAPEFDEVTAFRVRTFGNGDVGTGWKYHASNGFAEPYYQFCYYRETENKTRTERYSEIAINGQINEDLRNPFNVDMREAFKLCVWH
jgi:hypothetical protein